MTETRAASANIGMNKRDAKRVAKFHSRNPNCSPFDLERFTSDTWRGHFSGDLRALKQAALRHPNKDEAGQIEIFLTNG